jgi:hypothetical protein
MPKRLLAVLLAAVAAAGVARATPSRSLPALVSAQRGAELVRVDSGTLQPLAGKRIEAGSGGCAGRSGGTACWRMPPWTLSPARTLLALARNGHGDLRLVNLGPMRVAADIELEGGPIGALAWLVPGRLLAIQEVGNERQQLLAVDVARRRVTAHRALGGSVLAVARTPRELVLLVAPANAVGRARLAVASPSGGVRFVRLERIRAGSRLVDAAQHRLERRIPGLAVDPQGRRAFVVDPGIVAEIDLRSLAVAYHEPKRQLSARTKSASGPFRSARWLGDGLLAASGTDGERPAGLLLVNNRRWTVRTLDPDATSFVIAGDLLLATGADGLSAYGRDGVRRFRLFDGKQAWVTRVHAGRAYVGMGEQPLRIVDLAAGTVVGTRADPVPELLVGVSGGWWNG